jgi:Pin2-interacting protein X1
LGAILVFWWFVYVVYLDEQLSIVTFRLVAYLNGHKVSQIRLDFDCATIMNATGMKWSKDEARFGKQLMKKAGWEEGKGLGRKEDGITEHVRTVRKDNVLGIGYEGQVQQTWSTQSVGFADILKRINTQSPAPGSEEDEEGAESVQASPVAKGPSGGRGASVYAKRQGLKTEALRSEEGKAEVLGAGSSNRKRDREDSVPIQDLSSLTSPLLQRTMTRFTGHEPRPSATTSSSIQVTKPDPRPPRPSQTPFCN